MANFQFHGAPNELLALADDWVREYELHAAVERFFPEYQAADAADRGVAGTAARLGGVNRVCFGTQPLVLAGSPQHGLVASNPDCLFLSLGDLTAEGLRESALATSTGRGRLDAHWNRVVRRIREDMHAGARVLNPETGATASLPHYRHTAGAHALALRGTIMLAAAGWNQIEFSDCLTGG